ncbi:MAG: hypothetical protein HND52_19415 [Ignavibacteriae bacterium]|jgi:uncharacterized damage-inducible protein DinB|nr:hypothetical protein [Ignavibacteriota bacterium]NOH00136.1 hypothetical protein [Ignavibacteriota bacterium]
MKTYFEKLFEFNYWANSVITECLANQESSEKESIELLAHILLAEKLWLSRILKSPRPIIKVWSNLSISKCRALASDNQLEFRKFLLNASEEKLNEEVDYKTSKGKIYKNKISDILTQLITHGSHHRSQINLQIKQNGGEPAGVDYITFIRAENL